MHGIPSISTAISDNRFPKPVPVMVRRVPPSTLPSWEEREWISGREGEREGERERRERERERERERGRDGGREVEREGATN